MKILKKKILSCITSTSGRSTRIWGRNIISMLQWWPLLSAQLSSKIGHILSYTPVEDIEIKKAYLELFILIDLELCFKTFQSQWETSKNQIFFYHRVDGYACFGHAAMFHCFKLEPCVCHAFVFWLTQPGVSRLWQLPQRLCQCVQRNKTT